MDQRCPFRIKGQEGVVVYYARAKVNLDQLQDKTNTDYLIHAADFIGSAWSLRLPRAALMIRRHDEIARNFRRLKHALMFLVRAGVALDDLAASADNTDNSTRRATSLQGMSCPKTEATRCDILLKTQFQSKTKQFLVKLRGGGTLAPPPASLEQSTLTAVGVLLTLLTLSALSRAFSASFGTAYQFPLPPMAALLALQFGLTAAPAAQPNAIILGQLLSIGTALVIAEIPTSYLHVWMKQSLACAIAVLLMAKTSIVNPPAAANAFVFADGTWRWTSLVTALVGSIIAILYSVVINNLSEKRQYPSSWGVPEMLQCIKKQQQKPTQYASRLESILQKARARTARKSTSLTDSSTEHPLNNRTRMNPMSGSSGKPVNYTASVSDVESGVATPTT
ncbi:HPP family [Fragilaria crotonensis]|nr:HPP family [Fragilaria crotonensis]